MKPGDLLPLFKDTATSWSKDKAARLAAALSFYTVFSLAPLILIAIAVAGLAFGREAASGAIAGQISRLIGPQAAEAIQGIIQNANRPAHGIIASVIGVVTLLFGASGVFGQLKDALNTIWGVQPKPGQGIWMFLKDRFLSFTMVLGVGFLLLVSLLLSTALSAFTGYLGGFASGITWLGPVLDIVISLVVVTVLLGLMFKGLPDAEVQWRDVWIGAFLTAVLFTVGKFLIGLYLGRSSVGSAYGAAGSLVILLLWTYYSSQILFFGAEFTKVYAQKFGSQIVPEENAVAVTQETREEQGMPERSEPSRPDRPSRRRATH